MSRKPRNIRSLESALDEERREVLALLDDRPAASASTATGKESPVTPTPPIRSMLDISTKAPRPGSTAGIGVGVSLLPNRPRPPPVRSMLDPTSPPPTRLSHSATTSPLVSPTAEFPPNPPSPERNRTNSEVLPPPSEGLKKIIDKEGIDIDSEYQFGMLPSIPSQALPKRVAQGGRSMLSPSAMAAAISGELSRGRESRQGSTGGVSSKSKSPSARLSGRSQSPGTVLNTSSFNTKQPPGMIVTDSGKSIDGSKAYRKLSDTAFRKAGSSLAPTRKGSVSHASVGSADSASPDAALRVPIDEADHAIAESSDEDVASTEDEAYSSRTTRGRRRKKSAGGSEGDWEDDESAKAGLETTIGMGRGKGPKKVKSLLAAAEEERLRVSANYNKMAPPVSTVPVSAAADEKMIPKKSGVHPHTSFDHAAAGFNSAATSENEADLSDIKRAQKLSINMSHIDSTIPNRVIRTILRGDFAAMEQEAEDGSRRQRLYLVATDLSDEAVYALEWTIGTILRDGDTLFAMYAVDEETGTGKPNDADGSHVGEGTKAAHDAVNSLAALTERTKISPVPHPSPLVPHGYLPATESISRPGSTDSRSMSKSDSERHHAIEDISQTCVRLLRKTKLQVRVAVEVIHCKSPKHLITEAIDTLNPTLVILGSRGRSALKGVLLGSFSNYLVTKSSVPVMVARKKLRKHAKYNPSVGPGGGLRLSNNLSAQRKLKLAEAKID